MSFKQFETDLMNALEPLFTDLANGDESKEIFKDFGNYLINGERIPRKNRRYSEVDRYRFGLLSGFTEISESFYTLRDIETIIAGLTTRQSKIAKMRMLSYHIHNYLNENYILETRLIQYPTNFLRSSKRWNKDSKHVVETIKEAITNAFKGITTTRGSHVHSKRYTDDELDRLSMLERATTFADSRLQEPILQLFRIEFSMCRRKWLDTIRNNNDAVEKILDYYVSAIKPFVFDEQGKIIIPKE
jgi:hypothetical protein